MTGAFDRGFLGPGNKPMVQEHINEMTDRLVSAIKQKLEEFKMSVRCKFVCSFKDEKTGQICFHPVYEGSEENRKFFQATPGGDIRFFTVNLAALNSFEMGKEYYVDFSPAN